MKNGDLKHLLQTWPDVMKDGAVLLVLAAVYAVVVLSGSLVGLAVVGMISFLALHRAAFISDWLSALMICSLVAFAGAIMRADAAPVLWIEAGVLVQWGFCLYVNKVGMRLMKTVETFYNDAGECAVPEDVCRLAVRTISGTEIFDSVGVLLIDKDTDELVVSAVYPEGDVDAHFPRDRGVVWQAYSSQKPVLLRDVRFAANYIKGKQDSISEIAVPIRIGGRCFGVVNGESAKMSRLANKDVHFLSVLSYIIACSLMGMESRTSSDRRKIGAVYPSGIPQKVKD